MIEVPSAIIPQLFPVDPLNPWMAQYSNLKLPAIPRLSIEPFANWVPGDPFQVPKNAILENPPTPVFPPNWDL